MRTIPALQVHWQPAGQSEHQELVERLADTLVRLLKDRRKGIKVPGVDPEEIEALEVLARPFPGNLCNPTLEVVARSTEAYFILWAHTPRGYTELWKWESQEPKKILLHLEAPPRFLREVMTYSTLLNDVWRWKALGFLSAEQRIALAFLSSKERTLTEEEIYNAAGLPYPRSRNRVWARADLKKETVLLGFQDLGFKIDIVVTGFFHGMPRFFLPFGHENRVFRDLWQRNKQGDGFVFGPDNELGNAALVPRVSEIRSWGGLSY
ncbi:hypothetical protein N0V83_002689 [Neocucurbitaria cava]|uniref:Uncharacterized protein n=1 Tax=Neocucurbitaria cava TaxID=798079 RepID=A0A9W9CP21_9PLEO|nr:hypothetical protein N0V83_002689 [Neocucurbitaria cava]